MVEPINAHIIKFFLIKGNKILFSEKYAIKDLGLEELKNTMIDSILLNLIDIEPPPRISREDLDETQIIYSYLKSKTNACKHLIIPQDLVNTKAYIKIANALDILI